MLTLIFNLFACTNVGVKDVGNGFLSQYLQIDNKSIHYYQLGAENQNESPVILLTGVGTSGDFWNVNFVKCLAKNRSVYILDYPAINSYQPFESSYITIKNFAFMTNQFVTKLNLHKPILVGWSMGGSVALEASFIDSRLYASLYILAGYIPVGYNILNPFPPHPPFKTESDVMNYVFSSNIHDYSIESLDFYLNQLISTDLTKLFPNDEYTTLEINALVAWGFQAEVAQQFRKTKVPAVFFIPESDMVINQNESVLETINQYGKLESVYRVNTGHDLSLEDPEGVCKSIINTFNRN